MDLDQARELMRQHVADDRLRKHCLASAAVLGALARRLGHDEQTWAVTGMLHDLDYDQTVDHMDRHGLVTEEILRPLGLPQEALAAIPAHNAENLGLTRQSPLDFALTCGETVTGLIAATALVYPDKKLASVKVKSVTKRMKEKAFAKGVNRDHILLCSHLDLELSEFVQISLEAMRQISDDLGL